MKKEASAPTSGAQRAPKTTGAVPTGAMRHVARSPSTAHRTIKTATKNPERVRARRETLINAAIEVFCKKGFHQATVRDIGEVAGMTQGTIYNYVSSKDDILYLALDRIVEEYHDQVALAMKSSADPIQRVRSAVRAVSEVMYRRKLEIKLIYQDSHLLDKQSRRILLARVEGFIQLFEKILEDANRALGIRIQQPHVMANILTFLPVMLSLRDWSLKNEGTAQERIEAIADFVIRGLGYPPLERS